MVWVGQVKVGLIGLVVRYVGLGSLGLVGRIKILY